MADAVVPLSHLSAPRKPGLLARVMRRLIAARIERGTYEALSCLTDHVLADIGIGRGQIREIARTQAEEYLGAR